MKSFRETLIENTHHYEEKLEEGELRVHLLLTANDIISVTVTNNTKITDSEYARIQDKIERTKIYQTMADAMADIDQTVWRFDKPVIVRPVIETDIQPADFQRHICKGVCKQDILTERFAFTHLHCLLPHFLYKVSDIADTGFSHRAGSSASS